MKLNVLYSHKAFSRSPKLIHVPPRKCLTKNRTFNFHTTEKSLFTSHKSCIGNDEINVWLLLTNFSLTKQNFITQKNAI